MIQSVSATGEVALIVGGASGFGLWDDDAQRVSFMRTAYCRHPRRCLRGIYLLIRYIPLRTRTVLRIFSMEKH